MVQIGPGLKIFHGSRKKIDDEAFDCIIIDALELNDSALLRESKLLPPILNESSKRESKKLDDEAFDW